MNKTANEVPARAANIAAIVDYIKSGIKPTNSSIGIELEHFVVHDDTRLPVTYSEEHGVKWILTQLKAQYPHEYKDGDDLIGVWRRNGNITESVTIEPASQIELSAGPFTSLTDAQASFEFFEHALKDILDTISAHVELVGYQPVAQVATTELIPKRRYKFMNEYLNSDGREGRFMMRGTASTQVSIDYTSVEDCLRKARIASTLVPILYLISDNSAIFEGKPRTDQLVRTRVWRRCDPDRCNEIPHVFEDDFSLETYAAHVLDTPAIVTPCPKDRWCFEKRTFNEVYAEREMTHADVEHAISMLFNDVRIKTYLEIRPADALPIPYALAYAAFIKGLFATEENLQAMEHLFGDIREVDEITAKDALIKDGYTATIYGRPVAEITDALIEISQRGQTPEAREIFKPLEDLMRKHTTLACEHERAQK